MKRFAAATAAALVLTATVLWSTAVSRAQSPQPPTVNLRRTVTVEVVERTKGAVVNISATKLIARRESFFSGDPFFGQFDIGGPGRTVYVPASSLGSGFIIDPSGYVVTNNHVIDRGREITVELNDGRKLPATVISADPEADLAVLKISDPKGFPCLTLGDSSDLMPGEPVIAVGNPLGYSHSVSTGIVSANHRELKDDQGHVMMSDLIQTDAAINPGNSGGPLLNAYGQVIGINTAIRGDAQNIGFAIQVNKLRDLIPHLMDPQRVNKVELPLTLAEHRTISPPANITATIEVAHGPGQGKTVADIDGKKPANIVDAYVTLLAARPGTSVTLKFTSGDEEKIPVKAAPPPDGLVQAKQKLGLVVQPLTPAVADKYNLDVEQGLLVTDVVRGSVAQTTGIQPGDVLLRIGGVPVKTIDDLGKLLEHLQGRGRVSVTVVRADQVLSGWLRLVTERER